MSLILADSRPLRFFSFTVFYIAQGLPFGLVTVALPAYLAEQGVSGGVVGGFIGLAMLPWSFKLFAGPVMDRFSYLAMGRRRPWVILSQLGLVLTGVAFAFFPQALERDFSNSLSPSPKIRTLQSVETTAFASGVAMPSILSSLRTSSAACSPADRAAVCASGAGASSKSGSSVCSAK